MDQLQALGNAISAGDTPGARALLEREPGLRARLNDALPGGAFGETALLRARRRNDIALVDLLLRHGADINQKSHWKPGPFGVLDEEDATLLPLLIERGATLDAYAAARHGMMAELRALVAANPAAVRMRGGDGQTPLHVAKTVEVARFLLDHGAEIDARDVDHESTPAQYLIKDRTEVARFLVERGAAVDILLAAALGDAARVRGLLDRDPGAIRTTVDPEFFPMLTDVSGGHIYIWTLGKHNSAHDVARNFGHAALHDFLMERTPAALRRELAHRSLVMAAEDNDVTRVRAALDAGAPVAHQLDGTTALHWAAFHGNLAMARLLLERGAPRDVKDRNHGGTPLNWAQHGRQHGWYCRTGDYAGTIAALEAEA